MTNLVYYTTKNLLPEVLHKNMADHLKKHLEFAQRTDEAVLQIYPTTIRRRVLRHLYQDKLSKAYLFTDCPRRLLDLILAVANIETFMPKARDFERDQCCGWASVGFDCSNLFLFAR